MTFPTGAWSTRATIAGLERSAGQAARGLAARGALDARQNRGAFCGHSRQPKRESERQRGHSYLLQRGYDGAKRLSGRKRFVVCDTLGLWLDVVVLRVSLPAVPVRAY